MLESINVYMNLSQGSSPCWEGDWLADRRKALLWALGTGAAAVGPSGVDLLALANT